MPMSNMADIKAVLMLTGSSITRTTAMTINMNISMVRNAVIAMKVRGERKKKPSQNKRKNVTTHMGIIKSMIIPTTIIITIMNMNMNMIISMNMNMNMTRSMTINMNINMIISMKIHRSTITINTALSAATTSQKCNSHRSRRVI